MALFNLYINEAISIPTSGENVNIGSLVYLAPDGLWYNTTAVDKSKSTAEIKLALNNVTASDEISLLEYGEFTFPGAPLVAGDKYYVSVASGQITNTVYDNSTNVIRYVGTAKSTSVLLFNPDHTYISDYNSTVNDIVIKASESIDAHNHLEIDITDLDKYTQNEVDELLDNVAYTDHPNYFSVEQEFNTGIRLNDTNISGVKELYFQGGYPISWNPTFCTINIPTGKGPVLQAGQEFYFLIYNNTGAELANGKIVKPTGATLYEGEIIPTVILAKADTHETCEGTLMVTTAAIPNGSTGICTRIGRVSDVNTLGMTPGEDLWVSATTAGEFTNTRPAFPNYSLAIGGVLEIGTTDGSIIINFTDRLEDTFIRAWDGAIRETFNFTVASDGATITGSLERAGGGNLGLVFSSGIETLDTTPPKTVALIPGTATAPQLNYVYIPKSTGLLTVNTTGFPLEEHSKIADVIVQDVLTVQSDGVLGNRNWNDHVKTIGDNGHILHVSERIRQNHAEWYSGCEGTTTISSPTNSDVFLSTTSGFVYQLHQQPFPVIDTSIAGPTNGVHIVNNFTTPFFNATNLNTQIKDALDNNLSNKSFSFVLWGVQNKTGEESHIMINLPTGSYAKNSPDLAVSDAFNYSVYDIPRDFKGKGFLIARFTYVLAANGTDWSLYDTEDLRGKVPNITVGSGGGGGGFTSFAALTDTPNSYIGSDRKSVV